jgi:hypothetical protein
MINEVRNAVLSILNKNNYGYISPSDFNLFAANAQMEIYEEYYSSYNKTINAENARGSGTDYADIESPIAETLETFLVTDFLSNIGGNRFSVPTVATVGNDAYYILKLLCHPTLVASGNNTSVLLNSLVDSTATFIADGIDVDYVVVNLNTRNVALVETVTSESTIKLSKNIFLASGENYRIYSTAVKELEKVSVGKITMLNASNLTKPSLLFPSYTLEGQTIKAYPNTINGVGQIEAVYFRFPKTPKWTYITLVSGEPVFDQSQLDYQDFELPNEDGYKLVTKILEYCGMSIRETEVVQFGMAQQQLSQQ